MPVDPDQAEPVTLRKPPATSQNRAPVVNVTRGEAFVVKLRGLPQRERFVAQVKAGKRWVRLDTVSSNRGGRLKLPALDGRRPGDYVVRLKDQAGVSYFVRIRVTRGP